MDSDGNGFTNKEILLRLDASVKEEFADLRKAMEAVARTQAIITQDHENRLRGLELWKAKSAGVLSVFAVALTVFGIVYK